MDYIDLQPAEYANAQLAELVDALVSNTCGKPCRFDSGTGYVNNIQKPVNQLFTGFVVLSTYGNTYDLKH